MLKARKNLGCKCKKLHANKINNKHLCYFMNKKAIAPEFLIGGLIILILVIVVVVTFVRPGSSLFNSGLDLFGVGGCESPVTIAGNLQKEFAAQSFKKANETYSEFVECYPKLDPREFNEKIPENYLVKLGRKS